MSHAGLVGALMLWTFEARAEVLFTYNGFAGTSGLTLVGDATTAATSDGTVLRVTPAANNQSGAAYNTTAVPLGARDTFSTVFNFRITDAGGTKPADGFTFVMTANPSGLGALGGGLGYQGASANSMAIEFDTFNNGSTDGNSSNHVGIDIGGVLTDSNLTNVYDQQTCDFGSTTNHPRPGCLSNGDLWKVIIGYDGANLTVTLNDPAEGSTFTAINAPPIDIVSVLGTNQAFTGFTSGTGNGFENHDIISWQLANTASIVPEPSATLPIGVAVAVAAWFMYRRKHPSRRESDPALSVL